MHTPTIPVDAAARARLQAEREALLARLAVLDLALEVPASPAGQGELQASWQAILDALPAHVGLLDPQGRILLVNRGWREFACAEALHGGGFGIGREGVGCCASAGDCSQEADAAQRGIAEVLQGARADFSLEYPCRSPEQERWYRMTVSPIHPTEPRGCVVMHVDVTDRKLAEESLRRSETRLRAILDNEPECVKLVSPDGRLLSMNASGLAMIEAREFAQVAGRPLRDLIHPEDWNAYRGLHQRALAGETGHLQFRIIGLQGGLRWMDTHSTPMHDEQGVVEGVLSVTRDVTERQASREAMVRLERRYQNILAAAAEGIHGLDLEGRVTFLNPAAERLLGWPAAVAIGQPAHALFHHRHVDGSAYPVDACPILRTLRDGQVRAVDDEVFVRRDGQAIPVEYTVAPKLDDAGARIGAVVCFRDVSERLAHSAALERSEERFRLVARATANAIWDWDLAQDSMTWSGRLDSLFGYHPEDVQATHDFWSARLHPDDRERVIASLQPALEGRADSWKNEYRFRRRDGQYAIVLDHGFVVRDASGAPARMVGGMSDVTEMRTLEAQLRASQRLEAVGQLTGGIAHDFNNLLTVVLGNAELLDERLPAASTEQELARMILAAAQRGSDLTQRLLAFARKQALEVRLVELGELVRGMQHLMRRALGEHIDLILHATTNAWVMADAVQLESALLNLCINARDAMPQHGRLAITVTHVRLAPPDIDPLSRSSAGEYVRLEVRDSGHGIPEDVLPKVIEPFFTTKDTGKGTGLGLSMVYGLVKQSDGYFDIQSSPERGTCVRIHLPAAAAPGAVAAAPPHGGDGGLEGGDEHILLVEDDALVRRYAASQLRALGYRVSEADGSAQALACLESDASVQLMLTDVMMPGLNGAQLGEAARRWRPGLPVLFSSGYSQDALALQGRLPDGVLLLAKPYQKAELARRVRQALA